MSEIKNKWIITFGGFFVTKEMTEEEAKEEVKLLSDQLPPCETLIFKTMRAGY